MTETTRDSEGTRNLSEILAALRRIARDAGDAEHPADTDAEAIRRIARILSSGSRASATGRARGKAHASP